jgi:hypothetical protein
MFAELSKHGKHRHHGVPWRAQIATIRRRQRESRPYSSLMFAVRMTLPHLSTLSAISLPKSGGAHRHRHATEIGKPRLDIGIGKSSIDLLVEFVDDLCGRVLGRAEPLHELVS